jgi:hypothetical protein
MKNLFWWVNPDRVVSVVLAVLLGAIMLGVLILAGACDDVPEPDPKPEPLLPGFGLAQHPDYQGKPWRDQVPVPLERFGFFTWNPSVDVEKVREAAPHAIHFAYIDPMWVAWKWAKNGNIWEMEHEIFPEDSLFWIEPDGARTEFADGTWELRYTVDNAVAKAQFWAQHLHQWDGIFIDELPADLAHYRVSGLPGASQDSARVERDYDVFRAVLISTLRASLPARMKLVANTGSWGLEEIRELELDGIACEQMWRERRGLFIEECQRYDLSYCYAVNWNPRDSVMEGTQKLPRAHLWRNKLGTVRNWDPLIPR